MTFSAKTEYGLVALIELAAVEPPGSALQVGEICRRQGIPARYLDQLIGPYPEARERYRERSPIHHTEGLSCPVIFFQGLEDRVVPPSQAEMMVAALRAKGLPVAYLAFAGEQHGFRAATTIKRALEAELYFYGKVFGFEPADEIEPVAIDGLE